MTYDTHSIEALYAGADLINAADRSTIDRSLKDRYRGLGNGLATMGDRLRSPGQRIGPNDYEVTTATGPVPGTDKTVSLLYAGTGENRNWCISTAISTPTSLKTTRHTSTGETLKEVARKFASADIVYIDGLAENSVATLNQDFARIPAWIKQRVAVSDCWKSQIQSLKRRTRQEVSRILRRHGYQVRLTCEINDISDFYDRQYLPYIAQRYGETAVIVDRQKFFRECRRGTLLQLVGPSSVVATALLRPIGSTMAIVWTGMSADSDGNVATGATDALDYFSLLYAHLKGSKWLDFGPSRADLFDGILRYKRKWGSMVTPGFARQSTIFWTCNSHSEAVREFMAKHAFITIERGELAALIFPPKIKDDRWIQNELERYKTPGVSEYRIVSLSPTDTHSRPALESQDATIRIIHAASAADALKTLSG